MNKMINFLVIVENILCLYRNYFALSRFRLILACLRVCIFAASVCLCLIIQIQYFFHDNKREFIYFFLNIGNSVTIMILVLCQARPFKTLICIIKINHSLFNSDINYKKILNKMFTYIKIFMTIFSFTTVVTIVLKVINRHDEISKFNVYIMSFYFAVVTFCKLRYIFEYFVFYVIIFIISEQINCIIRLCCERKVTVLNINRYLERRTYQRVIYNRKHSEIYVEDEIFFVYINVLKSSSLFYSIFGIQVLFQIMLFIFILKKQLHTNI